MPTIQERLDAVPIYDFMAVFLATLGIVSDAYLNLFLSARWPVFLAWLGQLAAIPAFAALLDVAIKHFALKKPFAVPKTALISGLFIAGIIDPSAPIIVPLSAAAIAILSKHLLRFRARNIFNPAAFGIAVTGILFTYIFGINVVGAWWIASTLLVIPFGLFISKRMEKLPLTLTFFITYVLTLLLVFGRSPGSFAEPIFVSTFLFFASFMLIEPRTSPYTLGGMLVGGFGVGMLSAALPAILPSVEYTLFALLVMNVFKDFLDRKLPDNSPA